MLSKITTEFMASEQYEVFTKHMRSGKSRLFEILTIPDNGVGVTVKIDGYIRENIFKTFRVNNRVKILPRKNVRKKKNTHFIDRNTVLLNTCYVVKISILMKLLSRFIVRNFIGIASSGRSFVILFRFLNFGKSKTQVSRELKKQTKYFNYYRITDFKRFR